MRLLVSAHVETPHLYKDGSIGLKFTTAQEIPDDEVMHFVNAGRRSELGWLLWSPNQVQESDIPAMEAAELSKKPSERVRSVLYLLWKQRGSTGDFNAFYAKEIEKIIEHIKTLLD